ncbi:MAG: protein kinase [Proteobacteria bacterium]|nr:protein kinase [Pseudomonadota bacterium]
MDRERNFLYGVLAVRIKLITPQQLEKAASVWTHDSEKDLGEVLVDLGMIKATDKKMLAGLIKRRLDMHDGNASLAIQALGGHKALDKTFGAMLAGATAKPKAPPSAEDALQEMDLDDLVQLDSDPAVADSFGPRLMPKEDEEDSDPSLRSPPEPMGIEALSDLGEDAVPAAAPEPEVTVEPEPVRPVAAVPPPEINQAGEGESLELEIPFEAAAIEPLAPPEEQAAIVQPPVEEPEEQATIVQVPGPADADATLPAAADQVVADLDGFGLDTGLAASDTDRYTVKGEYGRGGMGRVLLAVDNQFGREVAIKELLAGAADAEDRSSKSGGASSSQYTQAAARFLREARVTGALEHPGIVPVYELGRRPDGTLFYTMRLVRGQTMAKAISGKALEEKLKLLPNFLDLCQTIAYSHSKGVIHRDLKPQNVMVGEFGETVLLDWGLVKIKGVEDTGAGDMAKNLELLKSAGGTETVAGQSMGTPSYMSPEQADGRIGDVDEKTDIWALGAILYEILKGRPPFTGTNAIEILGKVLLGSPEPIRAEDELAPNSRPNRVTLLFQAVIYMALLGLGYVSLPFRQAGASLFFPVFGLLLLIGCLFLVRRNDRRFKTGVQAGVGARLWHLIRGIEQAVYHYATLPFLVAVPLFAYSTLWPDFLAARPEPASLASLLVVLFGLMIAASLSVRSWWDKLLLHLAPLAVLFVALFNLRMALGPWPEGALIRLGVSGAVVVAAGFLWWRKWRASRVQKPQIKISYKGATREKKGSWRNTVGSAFVFLLGLLVNLGLWGILIPAEILAGQSWYPLTRIMLPQALAELVDERRWFFLLQTSTLVALAVIAFFFGLRRGSYAYTEERFVGRGQGQEIPDELAAIAFKCMRKDKASRYESAKTLAEDVRNFQTGMRVSAYHYSITAALMKWVGRHRTAVTAGLIFLFLIILGGSTGFVLWQRAEKNLERSNYNLALAWAEKSKVFLKEGEDLRAYVAAAAAIERDRKAAIRSDAFSDLVLARRKSVFRELMTLHTPKGGERVAISPDGRLVVTASDAGGPKMLWDLKTGRSLGVFEASDRSQPRATFTPDGAMLACGGEGQTIKLWDVRTLKVVDSLQGHENPVTCVAFSPNGKLMASAAGPEIRLWNMADRSELGLLGRLEDSVTTLSFSPDGRRLAAGVYMNRVILYSLQTAKEEAVLPAPDSSIETLSFSPDSAVLAGAFSDRIVLWDVESRAQLADLGQGKYHFSGAVFSPDGAKIVAGTDESIVVWDVAARDRAAELRGHENVVLSVAFSRDGSVLASGSLDETVRLWAAIPPGGMSVVDDPAWFRGVVALSRDGSLLASALEDGSLVIWDLPGRRKKTILSGHLGKVTWAAFSPDEKTLVSRAADGQVLVWDLKTGQARQAFKESIDRFAFLDPRTLAEHRDQSVVLWGLDGSRKGELASPGGRVTAMALSRDGTKAALGGQNGLIQIWDPASRQQTAQLGPVGKEVVSLTFAPDGLRLAADYADKVVRLWNLRAEEALNIPLQPASAWMPRGPVFSPNGRILAGAVVPRGIILWDVFSGAVRAVLKSPLPQHHLERVVFSPDGRTVMASGVGSDKVVVCDISMILEAPKEILREAKDLTGLRIDGLSIVSSTERPASSP